MFNTPETGPGTVSSLKVSEALKEESLRFQSVGERHIHNINGIVRFKSKETELNCYCWNYGLSLPKYAQMCFQYVSQKSGKSCRCVPNGINLSCHSRS